MTQHYLKTHVHLTLTEGSGILLDLRRGEYIGLTPVQVGALSRVVHGWPALPYSQGDEASEEVTGLLETLTKRGLLTAEESLGKSASPLHLERVQFQLVDRDTAETPSILLHHCLNLFLACVLTYLSLRLLPLRHVLRTVEKRKVIGLNGYFTAESTETRHLVSVFLHLRPLYYSCQAKCLFDSLVLINFLARYRRYPQLVIGVKSDPFLAHSWVQQDLYVLNGRPGYIRHFSPLLSV